MTNPPPMGGAWHPFAQRDHSLPQADPDHALLYMVYCPAVDGSYTGITSGPMEWRRYQHHTALSRGLYRSSKPDWQEDWYRYGPDAFEFAVLGHYPKNLALGHERFLISTFAADPTWRVYNVLLRGRSPRGRRRARAHRQRWRPGQRAAG